MQRLVDFQSRQCTTSVINNQGSNRLPVKIIPRDHVTSESIRKWPTERPSMSSFIQRLHYF